MTRDELLDAVDEKTNHSYDFDILEMMTDEQLHHILNPEPEKPTPVKPVPPVKPRRRKTLAEPPRRDSWEYVEHLGRLCRLEHWSDGSEATIPCGERVPFEGRTVSAGLVLHWLRTGERMQRVPKPQKIKAAIRVGSRVYHLGRFATIEEATEAKAAARFRVSLGLNPVG